MKQGFLSVGVGLGKAWGHGVAFWVSKACSGVSTDCAAVNEVVSQESINMVNGVVEALRNPDIIIDGIQVAGQSSTAEGALYGRGAGLIALSKVLAAGEVRGKIGLGVGVVAIVGNGLKAAEIHGSALSGELLVEHLSMGK